MFNLYNKSKRTIYRRNQAKRIKEMADKIDLNAVLAEIPNQNDLNFEQTNANLNNNTEMNIDNVHSDDNHEDYYYEIQEPISMYNFSIVILNFNNYKSLFIYAYIIIDIIETINSESSNLNELENNEQNEKFICASLITLFFDSNLTQSALKKVIELMQLLTPIKLPKTFDQLLSKLETENLAYNKIWYCQNCNDEVELARNKQRNCLKCHNKLALYIYFIYYLHFKN